LMLVVMYAFGFLRLRCRAAFGAGLCMVGSYEIVTFADPVVTTIDGISSSFFVVSSAIIGAFTCYILERHERQRFLDLRTMDHDKQQLAALNQNLRDLALHDYLTGLLNRRLLDARLAEALALHKRYGTESCLMLLDLDGFKEVNDRHGHGVGDEVLRAVARTLLQHVRETDLVYRYGGDEFCVLMPNTGAETTFFIGNRVLESLRHLQVLEGGSELSIGFSAGCVEIDKRFADVAALIAEADRLLYRAKREGKGRLVADPAAQ
jgi:diguanylate cyclase (GGDEF)-like protein